MTLIAPGRLRSSCVARYTTPMPPRPATPSMRQPAISVPGGSSRVGWLSVIEGKGRVFARAYYEEQRMIAALDTPAHMSELDEAVQTVVNDCLGVKPGERVVV